MHGRSGQVHEILTGFAHSPRPLVNNALSPRFEGNGGEAWPVQTGSSATTAPSRDAADRNGILTSSIPISPQRFACNVSEHAPLLSCQLIPRRTTSSPRWNAFFRCLGKA